MKTKHDSRNEYFELVEEYGLEIQLPYGDSEVQADVYIFNRMTYDMFSLFVKEKKIVTYEKNNGYTPIHHELTTKNLHAMINQMRSR